MTEKMMAHSAAPFAATPEGQATIKENAEEMLGRRKEFWREDCKEAGRILPDPTAGKNP